MPPDVGVAGGQLVHAQRPGVPRLIAGWSCSLISALAIVLAQD